MIDHTRSISPDSPDKSLINLTQRIKNNSSYPIHGPLVSVPI